MSETIRILVVDDHPVVRDGLVMMLNTQPDFEVIGEAGDGDEALSKANQHQPDILLLDIEMPQMDGVELLRSLQASGSTVKALVFTAFDSDERIVGAIQAGAKGYLLKGAPRDEIFNAIRIIHAGGSLLQPVIATKLMQHMSKAPVEPLTERETEVLDLMAEGKSNKEIANTLVITERTVKFHVSSILGKLGADNRTEAVTLAAQRGLVNLRGSS